MRRVSPVRQIYFPVVGLIVGVITALVLMAGGKRQGIIIIAASPGLPTSIANISGGLHLDGFMDMCDRFLNSRGLEARFWKLEEDSRVGSFPSSECVFFYWVSFALRCFSFSAYDGYGLWRVDFFRFVCLCCLCFSCARKEGLVVMIPKNTYRNLGSLSVIFVTRFEVIIFWAGGNIWYLPWHCSLALRCF